MLRLTQWAASPDGEGATKRLMTDYPQVDLRRKDVEITKNHKNTLTAKSAKGRKVREDFFRIGCRKNFRPAIRTKALRPPAVQQRNRFDMVVADAIGLPHPAGIVTFFESFVPIRKNSFFFASFASLGVLE